MAVRMPLLVGATVVAFLALGGGGAVAGGGHGTKEHPIALHHAASVGGEWQMTVLSVTPNAEQAFGAGESCTGNLSHCTVTDVAPPAGADGYMIGVSLRYLGAGSSSTETVVIIAIGSHNVPYPGQDCDRSGLVEGVAVSGRCRESLLRHRVQRCDDATSFCEDDSQYVSAKPQLAQPQHRQPSVVRPPLVATPPRLRRLTRSDRKDPGRPNRIRRERRSRKLLPLPRRRFGDHSSRVSVCRPSSHQMKHLD
jgi:hypothetical protein